MFEQKRKKKNAIKGANTFFFFFEGGANTYELISEWTEIKVVN